MISCLTTFIKVEQLWERHFSEYNLGSSPNWELGVNPESKFGATLELGLDSTAVDERMKGGFGGGISCL